MDKTNRNKTNEAKLKAGLALAEVYRCLEEEIRADGLVAQSTYYHALVLTQTFCTIFTGTVLWRQAGLSGEDLFAGTANIVKSATELAQEQLKRAAAKK